MSAGVWVASIGALLSAVALGDFFFHWNVCGSSACGDPRWHAFGSVGPIPLSAVGICAYVLAAVLQAKMSRTALLAVTTSAIVGAHAYLLWVQLAIIHSYCLLCIATSLMGLGLYGLSILNAVGSNTWRTLSASVAGAGLTVALLSLAHRGIPMTVAPDPLVRINAPAIYRPEQTAPQLSLVDRMRAAKAIGPEDAEVQVEIFMDFQCPKCAELEALWPKVMEQLGPTRDRVRVTWRIFLLEGHPLGWQAAFLALGAGADGKFIEAKDRLFARQSEWVSAGDPSAALRNICTHDQLLSYSDSEVIKAAKAIIREDAATGAAHQVSSAPSVLVSRRNGEGKALLLDGLREIEVYSSAILNTR